MPGIWACLGYLGLNHGGHVVPIGHALKLKLEVVGCPGQKLARANPVLEKKKQVRISQPHGLRVAEPGPEEEQECDASPEEPSLGMQRQ